MKNIIILAIIFCSLSAKAQITFKKVDFHETIVLKTDTMTLEAAFKHLDMITTGPMWYFNRVVEMNGHSYLRYGIPMFKRYTWVEENGKYRRIKKARVTEPS
jgi:hypothetical protein